jgi:hypothetical protein
MECILFLREGVIPAHMLEMPGGDSPFFAIKPIIFGFGSTGA